MQVAQAGDPNAFAIVGGKGKIGRFEIAQSAHMVQILSETLYPNKKKAVVREYIANAIDAHRMNGNEAKPIEITLTGTEFAVKDYGPGIPHDKMTEVFCTYGGSTKTDDAGQIGGFGLGCKAGFAVADHFTVVNCHNGLRVVYAITKGTPASGGMPDYRIMVSTPTTETGITVRVPITADDGDVQKWRAEIEQIVRHGGFNATLNKEPVTDVIDFTGFERKRFGILRYNKTERLGSPIVCRYGNILYPVHSNAEIEPAYKDAEALIAKMPRNVHLVLDAPPGAVSIVPSREDLSYDDQTITFLNDRLSEFVRRYKDIEDQSTREWMNKIVRSLWTRETLGKPIEKPWSFPVEETSFVCGLAEIADYNAKVTLTERWHGYYKDEFYTHALKRFGVNSRRRSMCRNNLVAYRMQCYRKLLIRLNREFPKAKIYRKISDGGFLASWPAKDNMVSLHRDRFLTSGGQPFEKTRIIISDVKKYAVQKAESGDVLLIIPKISEEMVKTIKALLTRFRIENKVVFMIDAISTKGNTAPALPRFIIGNREHNYSSGRELMILPGQELYGPLSKYEIVDRSRYTSPNVLPRMRREGPLLMAENPVAALAVTSHRNKKSPNGSFGFYLPRLGTATRNIGLNWSSFRDYGKPETILETLVGGQVALAANAADYRFLVKQNLPLVQEVLIAKLEEKIAEENVPFLINLILHRRASAFSSNLSKLEGRKTVYERQIEDLFGKASQFAWALFGLDPDLHDPFCRERELMNHMLLYLYSDPDTTIVGVSERIAKVKERYKEVMSFKVSDLNSPIFKTFLSKDQIMGIKSIHRDLHNLACVLEGRNTSPDSVTVAIDTWKRYTNQRKDAVSKRSRKVKS